MLVVSLDLAENYQRTKLSLADLVHGIVVI